MHISSDPIDAETNVNRKISLALVFSVVTPGGTIVSMCTDGNVIIKQSKTFLDSKKSSEKLPIPRNVEKETVLALSKDSRINNQNDVEVWRCILNDGSVVKHTNDGSTKIFHPNGNVSERTSDGSQPLSGWIGTNNIGERYSFPLFERYSAVWLKLKLSNGRRFSVAMLEN